jgi:hypothetical protein
MPVATFDTLKFANALKAAGVPEKQAEAEATALAETLQLNLRELATRDDLNQIRSDLKREVEDVKREVQDVRRDIKDSEQRSTIRIENAVAELKLSNAAIKGELLLVKWMCGVGMTITVALLGIVLRVLLIRPPV